MRNLRLTIEYDGTRYAGWQTQKSPPSTPRLRSGQAVRGPQKTIQETIEQILSKILQEKVHLVAAGRTDSGVHALAQVANFKTTARIPVEKLKNALNSRLPGDIAISAVKEMPLNFHSCFAAKAKLYRYTILLRDYPSALWRTRVYRFPYKKLNVALMRKEAKVLLGRHNFKSFQAADKIERSSVRTIKQLKIIRQGEFIYFDIEADGFLYNMARNIVGTLMEIGRGKFPKTSMLKILKAKDRKLAGPTAPAKGLCLLQVKY
jgi:tRNA pseudouridine38-40 synthase